MHFLSYSSCGTMKLIRPSTLLSVSGRPMVVSSGMQSMVTMRRVYKTVKEHNQNFAILQCTSAYPLEAEDVNLRVITVGNLTSVYHPIYPGMCLNMILNQLT